jgi:RHS repeat-associated protein
MVRRNENGQQTVYLGKLYQHNLQTGIATRHYAFGGKLVALREGNNNVNFRLTDHLGSVTTTLFADGTVRANLRYDPWGKQRWASSTTPTRYRFTAQRFDDRLGLYDYNARYYDANIGRFISADVIVPGTSRLTPLTVGFHETMFIEQANGENAQLMQLGPVFRWSARQKQELGPIDGPFVPQTLNRFAYALGNPLRFSDPTGHYLVDDFNVQLSAAEVRDLLNELDAWIAVFSVLEDLTALAEYTGYGISVLVYLKILATNPITLTMVGLLLAGSWAADWTNDDLKALRIALTDASGNGRNGVNLRMGSNLYKWGIEVNGIEVISHLTLVNPVFSPKGYLVSGRNKQRKIGHFG